MKFNHNIELKLCSHLQLMNSQAVITVPCVLLLLFCASMIGVTLYLRRKQYRVISHEEMSAQSYHRKQAISLFLLITCFFVG